MEKGDLTKKFTNKLQPLKQFQLQNIFTLILDNERIKQKKDKY